MAVMQSDWIGMMNGLAELGLMFAVDGQTPVLSAGQVTIPSHGCRTMSTSGSIEGLAATIFASPAPASEDALGWHGGGELSVCSSPLNKFAGERAEAKQVPYMASVTASEELELRNNAPLGSDVQPTATTSPAIHSGDMIQRLIDAVAVCEERNRR